MPNSLGQKLKHAREERGLTLADVAHKTRISIARLEDMEADYHDSFGSVTYARSFLQTYAGFVGVDPNFVTDHMDDTPLGGAKDYRYLTQSLGRWVGVDSDPSLMPDAPPVRAARMATFIVAVFFVVLVGGMLWAKAYFTERKPLTTESAKPALVREATRDLPEAAEEIRPAMTQGPAAAENIPIRRALPVEDGPKARPKK